MEFTRPRGTRDFLFTEMRERKEAESTLRNVFENYGFQEIKTPLFEELKLFTTKSGEEIVDQLYNFKDKSDRELALRPELTAPVARLYLNELQKTTAKPIKLYYYGSCFRYERPQKGRFRQFWQFGCELIGAKSPEGEAEVISMCNESLESLGITPADININHLGIIRGLFAHFNIDTKTQREIMVIIDKGDKELLRESLVGDNPVIDNEELNNVLLNLIDMVGGKEILPDIEKLVKPYDEPQESLAELEELVKTLDSFGVDNYTLNLGVARGLDYYTGIVFEVYIPELGAQKQVCGGGTYSLIKVFGGEEIESTGFAFGFDRLMNAIEELNGEKELKPYLDVFVAPINDETRQKSFEITQTLRKNGIATDVDLNRKKFKKLMNHANNINVGKVVIVGKKDLDEGKVTVKDMNSGDQELVSLDSLVDYIKGEL
ncbi:histidine--tRNA ligase [Methanobrevibacter woesei]|uniref:Histidine--tRNA ligase n=1 Tax=Methanobrevibacter woesei TaxID=190976 RepID=A0A2U1S6H3_9EURY|nr:histidine--tRNA ligase [Methanobrevibacter woesei]MCI7291445.1 histidine--tRNA ligase [Methanobrevibacter woesei]PWB85672.1 histidine--tRNA ligase [Methanobrevibacter woesei]